MNGKTIRLAKELILLAHHNKAVDAMLSDNIDRESNHYGDKSLHIWNGKHDRKALVVILPLTDNQYQTIKDNASQWY